MSMKEIISFGEDFVVERVDRGDRGIREEVMRLSGDTGNAALEGKDLGALFKASAFTGRVGVGLTALAAAKVGDIVMGVVVVSGAGGDAAASFESVISTSGSIKQTSASDLSAVKYMVLLLKRG